MEKTSDEQTWGACFRMHWVVFQATLAGSSRCKPVLPAVMLWAGASQSHSWASHLHPVVCCASLAVPAVALGRDVMQFFGSQASTEVISFSYFQLLSQLYASYIWNYPAVRHFQGNSLDFASSVNTRNAIRMRCEFLGSGNKFLACAFL